MALLGAASGKCALSADGMCFQRMLGGDRADSAKERLDRLVEHLADLDLDGNQEISLLAWLLSLPLDGLSYQFRNVTCCPI